MLGKQPVFCLVSHAADLAYNPVVVAGYTEVTLAIRNAVSDHDRIGGSEQHHRSRRHRLAITSDDRARIEITTVLERFHVYAAVLAYHRYRIEANYHPYGLVNIIGANTRRSRVIVQVFIYKG